MSFFAEDTEFAPDWDDCKRAEHAAGAAFALTVVTVVVAAVVLAGGIGAAIAFTIGALLCLAVRNRAARRNWIDYYRAGASSFTEERAASRHSSPPKRPIQFRTLTFDHIRDALQRRYDCTHEQADAAARGSLKVVFTYDGEFQVSTLTVESLEVERYGLTIVRADYVPTPFAPLAPPARWRAVAAWWQRRRLPT